MNATETSLPATPVPDLLWNAHFKSLLSNYSGYVGTIGEASHLIREYEIATTSAFNTTKQTKGFGDNSN